MSTVLFYEKPVAVNREQHGNVKIGVQSDFAFAAKTNSVPVTGVEFIEACKEYPIVFAQVGQRKVPAVLLGLRDAENLFVNEAHTWQARYIPAFVRRYPFVLAENGADQFVVCIDQASPAYDAEQGQALFSDKGENTPFLNNALDFLNAYQAQMRMTEGFVQWLEDNKLLTEMSAKTELTDGRSFVFNGLYIVNEKALQELDDKLAARLHRSGEAGWIYAHLISLSNMSRLVDIMATRKS